jgi:hypothetical protein
MKSFARGLALGVCLGVLPGCGCSSEDGTAHDTADGSGATFGASASSGGASAGSGGSASGDSGGAVTAGGSSGVGGQTRAFQHPGLLHTESDFERMRAKIDAGQEPWAGTWKTLIGYEDTSLEQTPQPQATLVRGGEGENFLVLIDDLRAMYGLALAWNVTKDERYAELAVKFMNAWSSTLTGISGTTDRYLAAGLYGYQLANVAEIMRGYSGWADRDREAFRAMLLDHFYPLSSDWLVKHDGSCETHFWANWDMCNLAGMMAIGVFADRPDIYQEALSYLYAGEGNGALESMIYYVHPGNLGQFQESGRDQGHSNLGVTLMGVLAKQAWNQGEDLFAWKNYRLLSAFEYIARYNVGQDVPFAPYGPNCVGVRQEVVSADGRGHKRRSWLLPLNHYRNQLGIAVPWVEAKHADVGDEVWRWSNDELGWGSLTESLDPITKGGAPKGLVGKPRAQAIVLSWWGSVGAQSYELERRAQDGAFMPLATVAATEDLTFADETWQSGLSYDYRVRATFADSESSDWSELAQVDAGPQLELQLSFDEAGSDGALENEVDRSEAAHLLEGATLGPGRLGQALQLDGKGAYAEIATPWIEPLSDFTIAAWLYASEGRQNARLFDFGANQQRYMAFAPQAASSSARFMMTKVSYFGEEAVSGTALATGTWVHVAVTLSGSTAILYVDGAEVARNEGMIFAPFRLGIESAWLGRSHYAADPAFSGKIDDFRVYTGALSADAIAELAKP